MNVPILTKRRELYRKQVEDDAMQKAVGAVKEAMEWSGVAEKGFLNGNAALGNGGFGGSAAAMMSVGQGVSSQGGSLSRALEARVTQNLASGFARAPEELELALAEQGMSWGPPFPPGRPLDPFWGYRRPPRTWDYSVGENVQISPRWNRISFQTIQSIWEAYDVAQIATQHLINDVRSLEYNWEPIPGIKADVSGDIEAAIAFFDMPDKRLPFRAWLAKYLQDVIKFDAGALYIRRNNADEPIALEVISGKTIIPLVDFYGRRPEDENDESEDPEGLFGGEIVPAYTQIIEGLPWDLLAADDLIYLPWNPEPESQYGRCPLERVMISANTDIRFQWHFLQYFTEGTVPAGFMEAPPDMSDPAQVAHWQEVWDGVMQGDQTKQTQIRWVPNGSKFTPTKDDANKFDQTFPLYLMRRTCAAHGVTPSDLGFTEEVNKACYSEDTEVLTQHGWRFYDEVAPTDAIATLNPDTGGLEYHVPDSLHVYPYEGEMVRFRAAGVDSLVTPDHKMWVRRRRTGTRLPLWEKVEAHELEDASWFWFAGGADCWHTPEVDMFTLPEVESQSHRKPERDIPLDLWLEFLGYVVSEGCVYQPSDSSPRYQVSISQNVCINPEKAAKIEACLERLPIAFSPTDRADGARVWQVGDKALWMWLREHIGHYAASKHLPAGVRGLRGLSPRQSQILLDALMLGDGTADPRPGCTARSYATSSPRLAGEVQELAWKLGWRAQICGGTRCLRVLMTPSKDFQLNYRNVSREHYEGIVWCFHVRNHLFVTRRNGKIAIHGNTGDTQIDVQFRVGTTPLLRHVEDVINLFTREHLKLRCRINFDDGKETEDRVATATADKMDIEIGVMGVDERRMKLGLHVDKSRPMPRFVNNTRSGPVPLLAIESMAGEIDPETYGPADSQQPVATPFSPPPGVIPPTGSPEQKQAAEHTAQSARDLVKATVGEAMSTDPTAKPSEGEDETEENEGGEEGDAEKGRVVKEYMPEFDGERVSFVGPDGETRTGYVQMIGPNGDVALSDEEGGEAETLVGWQELEAIDGPWEEYKPNCFRQVQKAADNTGGPGVTRGLTDPSLNAANPLVGDGEPTTIVGGGDGITVQTGIQGEDLLDDDEDDEDDATKQALVDLAIRRWRDSSRNRLKKGRAPRRFVDPSLPAELHDQVWAKLAHAKTRAEVDKVFADVVRPKAGAARKAERPPFHSQADAIVEHYAPLIAKALASLFSSADLDAAVAAGAAAKKKPVEKSAGPPPHLRASENSLARCANCCLANNPKCVKYGNWDVEPDQTCDGWEIAIPEARKAAETDPVKEAVIKALAGKASATELEKILSELYGDSMLQGAHDAAHAAGATIVASLKDVSESVPADYWSAWTPGYGEAAAQAAEGGMKDLLDQAGITIQGLTDSSINSIGSTVAAGLEAGSSVQSVGKELRATLEDPSRSETVANTETARATSAAAEETYAQNGIEQVEWLAEDDACPDCEALAAESPLDLGSDAPPDHPNCFPAGTVVSGPAVRATTMRQYQGDLVTVILESGKQFAVTPNHPILTRTGWCAAGDLDEGCDVLSALEPERIALLVNPDDYQAVALIEDVARASREALGMTARRVPMTAEDLHGDGTPGEYVDVVSAAGNPKVTLDIDEAEQVREQGLVGAVDAAVLGGSRLDSLGIARYSSSHRRVGSISECKAFLARRAGHPCVHRFAAVPVSNASLAQHPVYSGALNTVAEGERLDGLTGGEVLDEVGRLRGAPRASRDVTGFQRAAEDTLADIGDGSALRHRLAGLVEFDRVVELRRVGWSGHVFNLETVDGWYCANGIIAHNCRCAIAPVVDLGTPEAGGEEG